MKIGYKAEVLHQAPIETFDDASPAMPEQIHLFQKATQFLAADRLFGGQFGVVNKWGWNLSEIPSFAKKYITPQNQESEYNDQSIGIRHYFVPDPPFCATRNVVIDLSLDYYERWQTGKQGNTGYHCNLHYFLIDDGQTEPHLKRLVEEDVHYPGYRPGEVRITLKQEDAASDVFQKAASLSERLELMAEQYAQKKSLAILEDVSRAEMQNLLELLWQFYHPKYVPLPSLSELIDDLTLAE